MCFAYTGFAFSGETGNVILMIADGAGYNAFNAASFYEYGKLGNQPYDEFPVRLSCTTYALKENGEPMGYAPNRYWSDFYYATEYYTDSAAASTAICCGQKTSRGRIATDINYEPLETIGELAENKR